jgi:adenylate cyclase
MNSIVKSDQLEVAESLGVRRLRALIFVGVWAVLCGLLWFWPAWHVLEEQARDTLTRKFLVSEKLHPHVVLVDFSDASIQALGGWPLPRTQMADLVEELIGPLGAKAVGLDILFPEPGDAAGDARLASLAEHGPLVLSHVLDVAQRNNAIRVGTPATETLPPQLLSGLWPVQSSHGYVANHAGLAKARCVGHIGVTLDADGVVRRLMPLVASPQGALSTLSVAMLDCGVPLHDAKKEGLSGLHQATQRDKTDAGWRLPFTYGLGAFDSVEAAEVLAGTVDTNRLRGKYVLVGSSAVGLSDYVNTPLQALTPGVLVHAQALAQLIDHGVPSPAHWSHWLNVVVASLGALVLWVLWRKHKTAAWLAGLGLLLCWPVMALTALSQGWATQLLFVPAVCVGALVAVSALEMKLLRDIKQKALATLSHYVAEPVLEQLYALGLANSLKPQLRDITVLVVDMRNYTKLTDNMPLDEMAVLMREFLELITQPVLNFEGTLDRYSGDGLIAFWGAPLPRDDHAEMSLRCARALQTTLQDWNHAREARGEEAIGMRIGIESGRALVGDLGSSSRSVFTAVGTCINTAARLQELGRDLQCDLVVGPATAALAGTALRPLAVVDVKGLRSALQVFTWKDA